MCSQRNILITNDDGIDADGLIRLARMASEFGNVWVVAPDGQRSAASHSITLRHPIDLFPYNFPVEGVHAFTCSGTPADCARVGILYLMPVKPDILLSGINFGYNMASDIQYSATVGAAFEAERHGVPAIAFSEGTGNDHRLTDQKLPGILGMLIERGLPEGQIFNVNFPQCSPEECKGILENRTVSRDGIYRDRYKETEKLPQGGLRLQVNGIYNEEAEDGTDFRALMDRYISISVIQNICAARALSEDGHRYPHRAEAERILEEGEKCNPGPWGDHSRTAAHCAERIALHAGMDPEKAYVLGLLHDIGRKFGKRHLGHVSDGYSYMMSLGYEDVARVCLTHSFNGKSIEGYVGNFDTTDEETALIKEKLTETTFDDYDRLIQLCDSIAGAGYVMDIIDRMTDVKNRYGSYDPEKWNTNLWLKKYFERKMNMDLYDAAEKDTFEIAP